jgi:hypothetical protein
VKGTENVVNESGETLWDFVTLVAWWNLYGLPALLVAVAIADVVRRRSGPTTTRWHDRARSIRQIGLIHCALALHALLCLVQELLTMRTMGIPGSHVVLVGSAISTLVNPVLALGLLRRRQAARRFAIAWYVILSLIAVVVVAWMFRYGVDVDPATWPVQLVSKVMPFFLLLVMLLPLTKRLFVKDARSNLPSQPGEGGGSLPPTDVPVRWPVVSLLTVMFLIVVCSNLVIDMADWGYRLTFGSDSIP